MGGVFANGLEISGKAVGAKTIAAFPDVCMTPPENPATPPGVPVPYPNFAMAGDTENGTGKVLVRGKEANLKNKSDMSKTSGDEAGAAAKKGVITSKNTGKSFFKSWSPDVKFEGEPVVRMSDLTTNNHASDPGQTPPWAHYAGMTFSQADCPKILADVGLSVHRHGDKHDSCNYKGNRNRPGKTYDPTKPTQQSDHFPQTTCFTSGGRSNGLTFPKGTYDVDKAPCVCLEDGSNLATEHGRKSEYQKWQTKVWTKRQANGWQPTYKDAKRADLNAMRHAKSPHLNRDAEGNDHPALKCLELEMDRYFKDELGMDENTPVSTPNQPLTDDVYMDKVRTFRTSLK